MFVGTDWMPGRSLFTLYSKLISVEHCDVRNLFRMLGISLDHTRLYKLLFVYFGKINPISKISGTGPLSVLSV